MGEANRTMASATSSIVASRFKGVLDKSTASGEAGSRLIIFVNRGVST
jgi:hypothetical protein